MNSKVTLYLDIDGVLLKKGGQTPEHLDEFLSFVLKCFDCHWLTTHCKGDSANAIRYLSFHYPPDLLSQLAPVKPTNWDALKTEAINFGKAFVWLDDHPFESERKVLEAKQCSDSLYVVDLSRPNELIHTAEWLKKNLPHP